MSVPWYLMAKGKGGGGYKTASGPIVSINDALAAPLRSLRVGIDPVQDLHGYDSPWPSGGGKNLLDPSVMTTYSSGNGRRWYYDDGYTLRANQAYTFSVSGSSQLITLYFVAKSSGETLASGSAGGKITYTPTTDIVVYLQAYRSEVIQDANNFQLELGSTATAYTPYSNLCPISGWDEANVWVKPTYDPTANPTATIQLGQTVYGGYISVSEDGSTELVVDRAMAYAKKVDFPNKGTGTAMDYRNAVPLFPPTASMVDWDLARQQQISSMAKIANPYSESSYGTYIAVVYTSANNTDIGTLRISEDLYQSMTDDDALEIVYKLLNPITIPLSDITISTLAGQNVMWADCGEIDVEYLSAGGANADLMKLAVAFMGRK